MLICSRDWKHISFFSTLPKLCIISHSPHKWINSINFGVLFLRLSALLDVILYGDKMFNDKSIVKHLLRLSITLKLAKVWTGFSLNIWRLPFLPVSYKCASFFLVDSLNVYEEMVRSYICMVFFVFLFLFRQMLLSTMSIIIIEKKWFWYSSLWRKQIQTSY